MQCPSCAGTDIEWHDAVGDAICVACGTVCEENTIVSSIEFSEAGGAASVVGQFVSETCSKPYSGGMHASARSRYGFMRNSRETTLAKGRTAISEVAGRLRLQNHYIESAHRLFAFAVQRNFVQGRKTMNVVAVCLYIKCREDKSPHMLIDFSDALSINVFTLGSCFLKFCRLLCIDTIPIMDPSLFIHRFANQMDLGNKAQTVAQAALRIVSRMKRDWLVTGRRPGGICAAALLIAARSQGFPRTQAEIVKVLRVCGMTVQARLSEFEATPAAQLSIDELRKAEDDPRAELELEMDPPAFAKQSAALLPSILPDSEKTRKKSIMSTRRTEEREALYQDMDSQLTEENNRSLTVAASNTTNKQTVDDSDDDSDLDDEELGAFVLSAEEAAKKEAIWNSLNKSYLEEKALRAQKQEEELKASIGTDGKKKKKRTYSKAATQDTAEEALEQTLVAKKMSKKINYEALAGMFGPTGEVTAVHHTQRRPRKAVGFKQQDNTKKTALALTALPRDTGEDQRGSEVQMQEVDEVHADTAPTNTNGIPAPPPPEDDEEEEEEAIQEEVPYEEDFDEVYY